MNVRTLTAMILVASTSAWSGEATIGNQLIVLTAPSGYCELDEKNTSDARVLKLMRSIMSGNKFLGAYTVCEQLKDFRSGSTLNDYAQYYAPLATVDISASASMTKMICGKMLDKKDIDARLRKIVGDGAQKVKEIIEGIEIGETRFLGVMDDAPSACYIGVVQKLETELGDHKTTIGITASTVIKGKLLTYTLFSPYIDETTIPGLLKKHKENIRALLAANGQ